MNNTHHHWDNVYDAKSDDETSWYQARPTVSLELIGAAATDRSAGIVDVGCGGGILLHELAERGYGDLTGLDVSAVAIANAQARLGAAARSVTWIVADITTWSPSRRWGVWHDRAVFHFLTEPSAQDAYIKAMRTALPMGGTAIIATFAPDGPEKCSGLPVQRYGAATLAARLGEGFRLRAERSEHHVTPRGVVQNFAYSVLERV